MSYKIDKYFKILDLEEGASQQEIKEAYDRLSKELNPDINGNFDFFIEEYAKVEEAFEILTHKKLPPVVHVNKNQYNDKNSLKNNIGKSNTNLVLLVCFIIFCLLAILSIFNSVKKNKDNLNNLDYAVDTTAVDTTAAFIDTSSIFVDSTAIEYFVTPDNGFSPYDEYFGKGKYEEGTNNEIFINNSNENDVVVCLVDFNSGERIRNEFIRKGTNFKMSNIPFGTYYITWFSGNDWSPYLKINDNFVGGFQTDSNFSKSDGPDDLLECNGDVRWTIKLYNVENGNMKQTGMSESEFFK